MPENTIETVDIIVVGSGAGALTAALTAAINGASVVVLEKASRFGGTSASSGGGLWIPLNHLMLAGGVDDNREDALRYLRARRKAGSNRGRIADVAQGMGRLGTHRAHRVDGIGNTGLLVKKGNAGALGGHDQGRRPANAACGTGDEDRSSCE